MQSSPHAVEPITLRDAVLYEVGASRWAGCISWRWLQAISGRHFARKAARKHARYMRAVEYRRAHPLAAAP